MSIELTSHRCHSRPHRRPARADDSAVTTIRHPAERRGAVGQAYCETLEGRTLMSFSPAASYDAGVQPQVVVTGDFDNDGHLDLAFGNGSGYSVSVLRGDASGTFQQPAVTSAADGIPRSLAVGDFDADGKLDLAAVANYRIEPDGVYPNGYEYPANVSVMLGNGNGSFQAPRDVDVDGDPDTYDWGVKAETVAVGDFNADGTMDLAATWNTDTYYQGDVYDDVGRVSVLLAGGGGSFAAPTTVEFPYAVGSAVVADFNRDGAQDVVAGTLAYTPGLSGYVEVVKVLLGDGGGNIAAQDPDWRINHDYSMAVGDVDGDGDADLVTAGWNGVNVRLGDGLGGFPSPAVTYAAGNVPPSVALGDFDRDGLLDVAAANNASGNVGILRGKGGGAFGTPEHFAAGPAAVAVVTGDFNGDGWLDVATANLGGTTGANGNTASVLINDRNWPATPPPSVSVGDATVTEGNTGTLYATFTLTLSHASSAPVTVQYSTANLNALAGTDYAAKTGTVTIPAGQTSATFTVAVIGDRVVEQTESFFVNLGAATNATILDGQGVCTILDNEPRVSIGNVSLKEGNGKSGTAFSFTVRLSAAYDQAVTVNYATAAGTATAGSDYQSKSGTVTFAPGETVKTIVVLVLGDKQRESNETFFVDLFGASGNTLIGISRGIGTIFNDD